ncbi:hypothetical protein DENIS_0795 [Desulfonema ishimotonii]|uniref:Dinitrogenase iron-molybdenum cofactor biosynthesis domain-containing protein n=1 Tax=Desulfonema ishimotonii TaxID=45657 RepID=A0A401FSB1_9BACT|nr:NifB/NifX family molybdenum-iron cluster-binding protein [Desulfonema ishimotonii]GBC59854.1 hypothetical protein DENIS_0795 [Desulfonema ishimotonii]
MKIALPVWGERISPVLDTAATLLIITSDNGKPEVRSEIKPDTDTDGICRRWAFVRDSDIDVLICGAVSRSLSQMLRAAGIEVISGIAGLTEEVLSAYHRGDLMQPGYLMPGCSAGGQERRRGGLGAGGFCVCPLCEHRLTHVRGIPCNEVRCPACGVHMLRER